jgi:hypothetical protein
MAMATGVRKGPEDLAQFADTLSDPQLRALRFAQDRRTGRHRCPKKTVFTRVLSAVDAVVLEQVLLEWQQRLCGPVQDSLVIVDGKKIRHGGVEIVNAINGAGQYLGGVLTQTKSNEIPAARQLLARLDLAGKTVLGDALHTQVETGQQILFEQGGDYLMTVKANQPTLQTTLQELFEKQALPPSGQSAAQSAQTRAQSGEAGNPRLAVPGGDAQPGGLSGGQAGGPVGDPSQTPWQMDTGSGIPAQQPHAGPVASPRNASPQADLLGH